LLLVALGTFWFQTKEPTLMATPAVFLDGTVNPFSRTPLDEQSNVFEIFYVTGRQPDQAGNSKSFYVNERDKQLHFGTAQFRIGDEHLTWSDLIRYSLLEQRTSEPILTVTGVTEKGGLNADTDNYDPQQAPPDVFAAALKFTDAINARMQTSGHHEIYIFVPGFKVDFNYPVLVAGELWHYLGRRGAFIAYSWPSAQKLWSYFSDVETAHFSARNFRQLLLLLAHHSNAQRINIIVYSAGARIVSQALKELRLIYYNEDPATLRRLLKIGQVIFTGADIDLMYFKSLYQDGFDDIPERITIYTNKNDSALRWSLRFFGWPRLGTIEPSGLTPNELHFLEQDDSTTIIDVAMAEKAASGNGHGYFIKSPWVSSDILLTLSFGLRPAERGLRRAEQGAIWQFPDDYRQQAQNLALQIKSDQIDEMD